MGGALVASQVTTTLKKLTSALQALGIFARVQTVEPKSAPGRGLTAAVFLASIAPAARASGLNSASGLYVFTLRIYTDMLAEPSDQIDPDLTKAVDAVFDVLAGDFDLGATVRNVDIFGELGTPLKAEAGYAEIDKRMARIVDITIPLVINDTWTFG